jgi:hypothetical protein
VNVTLPALEKVDPAAGPIRDTVGGGGGGGGGGAATVTPTGADTVETPRASVALAVNAKVPVVAGVQLAM